MKNIIKFLLPLGIYFTILAVNHPLAIKDQANVGSRNTTPYLIANTNN